MMIIYYKLERNGRQATMVNSLTFIWKDWGKLNWTSLDLFFHLILRHTLSEIVILQGQVVLILNKW